MELQNSSNWRNKTLLWRWLHVLQNSNFYDVTFLVGEEKEKIHALKTVLVVSSPVFEAMFNGPLALSQKAEVTEKSENDNDVQVIELPDADPKSFRVFLQYVYTESFRPHTSSDTFNLLYLAHKYDVCGLISKCSEFIKKRIRSNNVITAYETSKLFDLKDLNSACCTYIQKNFCEVCTSEDFLNLKADSLATLIAMDEINASELFIFETVTKWARNDCKMRTELPTAKHLRDSLKDILKLIRFPLLSLKAFSTKVVPLGILTSEEVIEIYQQLTVPNGSQSWSNSFMLSFIYSVRSCHWITKSRTDYRTSYTADFSTNQPTSEVTSLIVTSQLPRTMIQANCLTNDEHRLKLVIKEFITLQIDHAIEIKSIGLNIDVKSYSFPGSLRFRCSKSEFLPGNQINETRLDIEIPKGTNGPFQLSFVKPLKLDVGRYDLEFRCMQSALGAVTGLSPTTIVKCNNDVNVSFTFVGKHYIIQDVTFMLIEDEISQKQE